MLRVQQRLGIAGTLSMPTVHALCHEVELAPAVVIPGTVNLVTALSHHIYCQLPVFITYSESDAISNIRSRVTNHGTVGGGDFTVTVHILKLQVTRSDGCKCIFR